MHGRVRRCDPAALDEVVVPVVHRFGPYTFYFFSEENRASDEPPHIHVRSGNGSAVFWLSPVSLREAYGYRAREVDRVRRIVQANRESLLRRWHEYFGPIG